MSRPAGGKIHALPIKVTYAVEGSGSYCTILNERHDVYVHPAVPYHASRNVQAQSGPSTRGKNGTSAPASGERLRGGAVMGSCCLRDVAWGVCYASPECVPAPRYHDFSVYTLDPSRPIAGPSRLSSTSQAPASSSSVGMGGSSASNTPVPAHRRPSHHHHPTSSPAARGTSSQPHTPSSASVAHDGSATDGSGSKSGATHAWHGKGFLSWALYEPAPGTTLIRGRLVKSRNGEFDGVAVEGGLEGLMAAAAAAERGDGAEEESGNDHSRRGQPGSGTGARRAGHGSGHDAAEEEDDDEQGVWGLEVELKLRMVSLGGRSVGDKEEFREMVAKGKDMPSDPSAGPGSAPLGVGLNGPAYHATRSHGHGTAGRTGADVVLGRWEQCPPIIESATQSRSDGVSRGSTSTHVQTSVLGRHHQSQSQQMTGAQDRTSAPRRIEPRLLSQPDKSPLGSSGRTQGIRASTDTSTPINAPVQASSKGQAPSHPQTLSGGSNSHAQSRIQPSTTSTRPGSSNSRSDSHPMGRSSSRTSNNSSQPHVQHRDHPSSSGTDEGMFHPPSDTTPRAQRGAARTGGPTQGRMPGHAAGKGTHDAEEQHGAEGSGSGSDREVTPPPITRPMGPPCTPGARAALASLLGPDGRMSPTAVKALANSSTFRKLLALAPISPLKNGHASAAAVRGAGVEGKGKDGSLKSPFGSSMGSSAHVQQQQQQQDGGSDSDMGARDPMNPFLSHPPAFTATASHVHAQRPPSATKPRTSSSVAPLAKPSPAGSDIPTPASTTSFYAPSVKPEPTTGLHGQAAGQGLVGCPSKDGCNNCSAMYSSQWLQKKRSGVVVTVCYDCGRYFNAHRAMRPKELWGKDAGAANAASADGDALKGKDDPGQARGQGKEGETAGIEVGGSNKRAKVEGTAGVRSSPRRTGTRAHKQPHNQSSSMSTAIDFDHTPPTSSTNTAPPSNSHTDTGPTDSPRRKKRPPPPPSPRRATRAAVKEHPEAFPDVDLDLIFGTHSGGAGLSTGGSGAAVHGTGVHEKGGASGGMSGSTVETASAVSMQLDGNGNGNQGQTQSVSGSGSVQGGGGGDVEFDINSLFGTEGMSMGMSMGMGSNMNMDLNMDIAGMGTGTDNVNMDNIDFDALLAQFVNEGGDVGQLWDLGAGMGLDLSADMGMGMGGGMGVGVGVGSGMEFGGMAGSGADVGMTQGAQGMQGAQSVGNGMDENGASGIGSAAKGASR